MAKENDQLNLTVVALVALVAIVGVVALVMNLRAPVSTGSEFAQAQPNVAGQVSSSGKATKDCILTTQGYVEIGTWEPASQQDCTGIPDI